MPIPHYRWSFSSLGLFECPKKYELLRAKELVKSPPSKAGNEGARLHEVIEHYIRDGVWSDELTPWKRILDVYKAKEGVCEAGYSFKWSIDQNEEVFVYSVGGFSYPKELFDDQRKKLVRCSDEDPDRWYTGYIDWMKITGNKCEIVDWKTGKVKLTKQLQLYAWVVMTAHPEIDEVKVTFHWLNHKDQISDTFHRKDLNKLFAPFKEILDDIDNCYTSDVWPEIPGDVVKKTGRGIHCSYCPVTYEHCSNGIRTEEF